MAIPLTWTNIYAGNTILRTKFVEISKNLDTEFARRADNDASNFITTADQVINGNFNSSSNSGGYNWYWRAGNGTWTGVIATTYSIPAARIYGAGRIRQSQAMDITNVKTITFAAGRSATAQNIKISITEGSTGRVVTSSTISTLPSGSYTTYSIGVTTLAGLYDITFENLYTGAYNTSTYVYVTAVTAVATIYGTTETSASSPAIAIPAIGNIITSTTVKTLQTAINAMMSVSWPVSLNTGEYITVASLNQFQTALETLAAVCLCQCNNCLCNTYTGGCVCNYACTCNCNQFSCTCNCNYNSCNCQCNYTQTCICNYSCTCNCNYCTCNCNYCACNCNVASCSCQAYCSCNCNYSSSSDDGYIANKSFEEYQTMSSGQTYWAGWETHTNLSAQVGYLIWSSPEKVSNATTSATFVSENFIRLGINTTTYGITSNKYTAYIYQKNVKVSSGYPYLSFYARLTNYNTAGSIIYRATLGTTSVTFTPNTIFTPYYITVPTAYKGTLQDFRIEAVVNSSAKKENILLDIDNVEFVSAYINQTPVFNNGSFETWSGNTPTGWTVQKYGTGTNSLYSSDNGNGVTAGSRCAEWYCTQNARIVLTMRVFVPWRAVTLRVNVGISYQKYSLSPTISFAIDDLNTYIAPTYGGVYKQELSLNVTNYRGTYRNVSITMSYAYGSAGGWDCTQFADNVRWVY